MGPPSAASGTSASSVGAGGSPATGGHAPCPSGYADCDALDGCETNTAVDPQNCGMCGEVCTAPHASASCSEGSCLFVCEPGYADCDANPGCEALLATDPNHCGACNTPCLGSCEDGFCDTIAANENHPVDVVADANNIYWVNEGTAWDWSDGELKQKPKNGGPTLVIATDLGRPRSVTVDATHVYWTADFDGEVRSIPIGGGATTVLGSTWEPYGVALDATHVYWTDTGTGVSDPGSVLRVPKNGGSATVLADAQPTPWAIAITSTHVYFSCAGFDPPNDASLRRVPIAGGAVEVLMNGMGPVATDGTSVYATGANELWSFPVAGGPPATFALPMSVFALGWDSTDLYFSSWVTMPHSISRMPKTGGAVSLVAHTDLPYGIAVDNTRVYWAEIGNTDVQYSGRIRVALK